MDVDWATETTVARRWWPSAEDWDPDADPSQSIHDQAPSSTSPRAHRPTRPGVRPATRRIARSRLGMGRPRQIEIRGPPGRYHAPRSSDAKPSVYRQRRAGNPLSLVRDQESHRVGNVLRLEHVDRHGILHGRDGGVGALHGLSDQSTHGLVHGHAGPDAGWVHAVHSY